MANKKTRFPSPILLLITLIVVVLQATVPIKARKLLQEEYSPAPVPAYGDDDDTGGGGDDGSKSGVQRSVSRHSGSANGEKSPGSQTVQMPPPAAKNQVSYNTVPPGQSSNRYGGGGYGSGGYGSGGYQPGQSSNRYGGGGYGSGGYGSGGYQPGYNYPHYP